MINFTPTYENFINVYEFSLIATLTFESSITSDYYVNSSVSSYDSTGAYTTNPSGSTPTDYQQTFYLETSFFLK